MSNSTKYLSYEGLSYFKNIIEGRYEKKGHTHSYLPLSGGALTGPLSFNGNDVDRNIIRINNGTGDATTKSYYGFTLKYLGSGTGNENALALYSDNITATSQIQIAKWLQDGTLNSRSILPISNNTYSLGNSSYKWSNIYATAFTGALSGNASSATKLSSTSIAFTPAETALTPDNVYTLVGGDGGIIKRGSWNYTGNGYISNDTTGVGTIDLAGTTVIQAANSSTQYTQLYLTPSTGSTAGCKTNEIFMYNNNGSGYSPSWTRILTNRNYTEYCLPLSGGTLTGLLIIKRSPSAILFKNSSNASLGYLGINADDDPVAYKADGTTMRHILHSGNYTTYAATSSHTHDTLTPDDIDDMFEQDFGIIFQ